LWPVIAERARRLKEKIADLQAPQLPAGFQPVEADAHVPVAGFGRVVQVDQGPTKDAQYLAHRARQPPHLRGGAQQRIQQEQLRVAVAGPAEKEHLTRGRVQSAQGSRGFLPPAEQIHRARIPDLHPAEAGILPGGQVAQVQPVPIGGQLPEIAGVLEAEHLADAGARCVDLVEVGIPAVLPAGSFGGQVHESGRLDQVGVQPRDARELPQQRRLRVSTTEGEPFLRPRLVGHVGLAVRGDELVVGFARQPDPGDQLPAVRVQGGQVARLQPAPDPSLWIHAHRGRRGGQGPYQPQLPAGRVDQQHLAEIDEGQGVRRGSRGAERGQAQQQNAKRYSQARPPAITGAPRPAA
jgi:hypothetical protein